MFDEFLGIPAHPLIVHAAVIFIPLQILAGFAYALVPATRRYITWAVLSLAVLGPVTAFVAKESGEALEERLVRGGMTDVADINEHADFADMAWYFTLGLGVLMVVLVVVSRGRRSAPVAATDADAATEVAAPAGAGGRVLSLVVGVLVLAVGAVTGYYVFKTGDTGAHMVWGGM
jgi:hypothetical protein